jgi:hypothetical protein
MAFASMLKHFPPVPMTHDLARQSTIIGDAFHILLIPAAYLAHHLLLAILTCTPTQVLHQSDKTLGGPDKDNFRDGDVELGEQL